MADKLIEYIAGGMAEGMTPEDIAKKHGVDIKIINDQMAMGTKVELEHTPDENVAAEIAKDHLTESPFYYDYLAEMEEELEENLEEDIKTGMSEEEREEKKPKKKASVADVIEFLKKNPNPKDEDVHAWAEENGYDVHALEAIFYKLASDHVKMMEKEDSLQDYLDAEKKEKEKKKNGEKKEEEEEESEEEKKKKEKGGKKKKKDPDEEEKKKSSKKEKKDSAETKEDIINRLFG